MGNYTEHYNLEKPEKTDYYDVDTANKNNDIIDNKLYEKQDKQPGKGLSTNDFTNKYKQKIDALQRIYRYCGSVETLDELNTIEDKQRGDVYNVNDINVDYCWNETEWTELGNAVDLSNYQTHEEAEQMRQDIDKELADKAKSIDLEDYQTKKEAAQNKKELDTEINNSGTIVSATEPTGENRKKVWIQKGKNLFNGLLESGILDNITGLEVAHSDGIRNRGYIKVEPNTAYTISNNNNYAQYLYEYDENRNFIQYTANTESVFTFTTTSTTRYLRFRTKISTVENDLTTLFQVEPGPTATEIEKYIEPTIYVKNDNDVYEEFIKKEDNIKERQIEMYTTHIANCTVNKLYKQFNMCTLDFEGDLYYDVGTYNDLGKIPIEFLPKFKNYVGDSSMYFMVNCRGMTAILQGRILADGTIQIYVENGQIAINGIGIRIHTSWFTN